MIGMRSTPRFFPLPTFRTAAVLLALTCLVPAPAVADSKQSATHSMQWEEAETIHIANEAGAINHHRNVAIEVEVFSSRRVIVSERGNRAENNLHRTYRSEDVTKWSQIWQGTWSVDGDTMQLVLTLHNRQCSHEKKWSDAAPQRLPCAAMSPKLTLTCSIDQVTLAERSGAAAVRAPVPVWSCTPAEPAELADTPSRWVLGKASCVKVVGGRRGLGYQMCTPN